ncbi:nucleic-acid-binding protein from transposon X-element [Trichonephila clavipes]|nr:nucleic-acid-binding protein from transposon X-element [Trichonephila clavipes]
MTNRKTGLPMPLFLLTLPKNMINKDIFNMTELCYLKIKVEPLRPKIGPAQCFRCQGFFHSSKFCTRNPKCVKCGQPHLTRNCTKTSATEATCCNCRGNHPANFTGCPRNPLNKPPPPPKVNFWEERARKEGNYKRQRKPKPTQQELQQPLHQPTPPPVRAARPSSTTPHQRVLPLQAFPLPTSECSSSSQTETNTHSFHKPNLHSSYQLHLQPTFNHRRNTQAAA